MHAYILVPIALVFLVAMFLGRNVIVRRRLTCPRTGGPAEVELLQRSLTDRVLGIESCDRLANPRRVDCGELCVHRSARRNGRPR